MERGRDIRELVAGAPDFATSIQARKASLAPETFWYPYHTLSNIGILDALLTGPNRYLEGLAGGAPIADIGAADGDMAYYLESLGFAVDIVDFGPTNFNSLRGARLLKDSLRSNVGIHEVDLDSQFSLPHQSYGLVLFLGILYHLKNPYYVLEALARSARYCLISTRIAQVTPDGNVRFQNSPVAYLLDDREANNDPTNYWIFSEAGLRRILKRTGWEILDFMTVGNTVDSDPARQDRDERAFCLVKSGLR